MEPTEDHFSSRTLGNIYNKLDERKFSPGHVDENGKLISGKEVEEVRNHLSTIQLELLFGANESDVSAVANKLAKTFPDLDIREIARNSQAGFTDEQLQLFPSKED